LRWQRLPLSSCWVETSPSKLTNSPASFSKRLDGKAQAFNTFKERNQSCSRNF
jgi:hypothetical protein